MSGNGPKLNDDAIAAHMSSFMAVGEINFSSLRIMSEEWNRAQGGKDGQKSGKREVDEEWKLSHRRDGGGGVGAA